MLGAYGNSHKKHNRFEFFRKLARRQRWFGLAEGHAIMSSVTVKLCGFDHDLLDAPCHPKFLLDTLAHQAELVVGVPALHHLSFRSEAEDSHALDFHLLAGGRHAPKLSLVGRLAHKV